MLKLQDLMLLNLIILIISENTKYTYLHATVLVVKDVFRNVDILMIFYTWKDLYYWENDEYQIVHTFNIYLCSII